LSSTPLPFRAAIGKQVRAPKTAELIATHLRGQVVRGELLAGDTLPPEVALMEQFGVSRPTLREAFRILETESLISTRRGSRGGAQVVSPDLSVAARYVGLLLQVSGTTIADVYEARSVIEPAAARMLAQRRSKQDIADLVECIEHLVALVESDETFRDALTWSQATQRFHDLMLERARSQTLAIQAGVLTEVVAMHVSTSVRASFANPDTKSNFRKTIRSYRKLVSFVEERDADGAERHWKTHMEVAGQFILGEGLGSKAIVDLFN
jgi:GntR family transcriptional regulator, transcriptional repressor for pyruvate dehydrogenase complex